MTRLGRMEVPQTIINSSPEPVVPYAPLHTRLVTSETSVFPSQPKPTHHDFEPRNLPTTTTSTTRSVSSPACSPLSAFRSTRSKGRRREGR